MANFVHVHNWPGGLLFVNFDLVRTIEQGDRGPTKITFIDGHTVESSIPAGALVGAARGKE